MKRSSDDVNYAKFILFSLHNSSENLLEKKSKLVNSNKLHLQQ